MVTRLLIPGGEKIMLFSWPIGSYLALISGLITPPVRRAWWSFKFAPFQFLLSTSKVGYTLHLTLYYYISFKTVAIDIPSGKR